ncbi:hypothetical protein M5689_020467 [Euphorbia peplus]|nr:hypothetical protein M5689_020467 [Euphorbia peplus]
MRVHNKNYQRRGICGRKRNEKVEHLVKSKKGRKLKVECRNTPPPPPHQLIRRRFWCYGEGLLTNARRRGSSSATGKPAKEKPKTYMKAHNRSPRGGPSAGWENTLVPEGERRPKEP